LFNQDLFPHAVNSSVNLYGSVPYLTAHSLNGDASIAWMNSADTWVHILQSPYDVNSTYASFVSEAPTLEFFFFCSSRSPKIVQEKLAVVTGYQAMPPAYALGFHFSKWGNSSAKTIMERNRLFSENKY
jgi:alpha 1,3-glucosidase